MIKVLVWSALAGLFAGLWLDRQTTPFWMGFKDGMTFGPLRRRWTRRFARRLQP